MLALSASPEAPSLHAINYARAVQAAMRSTLPRSERWTLIALLSSVDWSTGEGRVTREELARLVGLHPRHITRALAGLRAAGIVEAWQDRRGAGWRYRVSFDPGVDTMSTLDPDGLDVMSTYSPGGLDTMSRGVDMVSRGVDTMSTRIPLTDLNSDKSPLACARPRVRDHAHAREGDQPPHLDREPVALDGSAEGGSFLSSEWTLEGDCTPPPPDEVSAFLAVEPFRSPGEARTDEKFDNLLATWSRSRNRPGLVTSPGVIARLARLCEQYDPLDVQRAIHAAEGRKGADFGVAYIEAALRGRKDDRR